MKQKMSPCCARKAGQVTNTEANLRTIARKMSRTPESPRWAPLIAKARSEIAEAKQALVDHEATHAGDVAA